MLVKNKAPRLIVIDFKGKKYRLMPAGDAVEMPDAAKKESAFLRSLITEGQVAIVSGQQDDLLEDDDGLDALRTEAEDLGIKVDKRWGEAKIREAIDAKKAESQE
jgi:hypothetical protein